MRYYNQIFFLSSVEESCQIEQYFKTGEVTVKFLIESKNDMAITFDNLT